MPTDYFSDRQNGPRPRKEETINQVVWNGIAALVQSLVADSSFGVSFPDVCTDGSDVVGTNTTTWRGVLLAEHPEIEWPFRTDAVPSALAILDLVEFTHDHIAKPIQGAYHGFFRHHHLSFERDAGRAEFRQRINRLFARNGLAYELGADGNVIRLAPAVLRESLQAAVFHTGDGRLDEMLESARLKFLNPDSKVRREALEKLWDAWERIKTIESGIDKKAQVKTLLDKAAAEPNFRALVENEAIALTAIGNKFLIRHSETNRTPISTDAHVDYLFHRLFALIGMLLTSRVAST
jgi:hypothetical protein